MMLAMRTAVEGQGRALKGVGIGKCIPGGRSSGVGTRRRLARDG